MQQGICKLCGLERELQNSHYMPRGLYKRLREKQRRNPNPVIITADKTFRSSNQATDYLLCAECEGRFNHGAEAWLMASVAHGESFPLLDRLRVAVPMHKLSESVSYSGARTGIDTDKLGYFALSMVWRGAIHEWPLPAGGRSHKLNLGTMEESIRKYLVGNAAFPTGAAIIVHVCEDISSQQSMLEPSECADGSMSFEMLTLGVHFFVHLGGAITEDLRRLCCVTSAERLVFVRDCRCRLAQHFDSMTRTSKRSKSVRAEWPD
jgi:hypothetical protein